MLAAAVIILLVLALCFLYGWAAARGLSRLAGGLSFQPPATGLTILAGLCFLTWISQVLSLFMPVSLAAFLLVLAGGILISWFYFRSEGFPAIRTENWTIPGALLGLLVILSVLENGTHVPVNPDTGIYHAQTIRWIESFRVVPGLGNLHTRFAYNSSWLVLNSLFSFSFLGLGSFHLVPAALTLVAGLDFASGATGWLRGSRTMANMLRTILLPLIFFVLGSQISSPGTDLPVILILWLLLTAWLDQNSRNPLGEAAIFLIAISMVTIKLSAAPILILAAWIVLKYIRSPRVLLALTGIALVVVAPWLVRNVIISGYLVYPFPSIDLFNFDWKIPMDIAKTEVVTIQAWGRDPGETVEVVMAKPFLDWLRLWFIEKTTNQKVILMAAALSPLVFAAGFVLSRIKSPRNGVPLGRLAAAYLCAAVGAIYWLMTSPDIRFGYGFLLAVIGLALTPILGSIDQAIRGRSRWLHLAIMLGLIGYQAFFLARSFEPGTFRSRLVFPTAYPTLPSEPCPLGDGQVWCAGAEAWTQCWYDPFPCIPLLNDWAEPRGPALQDGFKPKANY